MKTMVFGVLALLLAAGSAHAQQKAGDLELQFYGMYYRTVGTDFTIGSGTIGGKIGPYLTDNLQVGLGPTLTITTTSMPTTTYRVNPVTGDFIVETVTETNTTTTFGTSLFVVYSFLSRSGKIVPYLGAQYFKRDFNRPFSEDRGSAGVNAGLKYFFARKTALDFSANYLWDLNSEEQGGSNGGLILLMFGLSFLF